jgi:hypothetical protein
VLCWTNASVWSDTESETVQLYNCQGGLVSSVTR